MATANIRNARNARTLTDEQRAQQINPAAVTNEHPISDLVVYATDTVEQHLRVRLHGGNVVMSVRNFIKTDSGDLIPSSQGINTVLANNSGDASQALRGIIDSLEAALTALETSPITLDTILQVQDDRSEEFAAAEAAAKQARQAAKQARAEARAAEKAAKQAKVKKPARSPRTAAAKVNVPAAPTAGTSRKPASAATLAALAAGREKLAARRAAEKAALEAANATVQSRLPGRTAAAPTATRRPAAAQAAAAPTVTPTTGRRPGRVRQL